MNIHSQCNAQSGTPSFLRRLTTVLVNGQRRQAVQKMRIEASGELEALILEAEADFDPDMAREIDRLLATGAAPLIRYSETLMPRMRERFDVSAEQFGYLSNKEQRAIKNICDGCPDASRCWEALRGGEAKAVCRSFCPNAATFERLSVGIN